MIIILNDISRYDCNLWMLWYICIYWYIAWCIAIYWYIGIIVTWAHRSLPRPRTRSAPIATCRHAIPVQQKFHRLYKYFLSGIFSVMIILSKLIQCIFAISVDTAFVAILTKTSALKIPKFHILDNFSKTIFIPAWHHLLKPLVHFKLGYKSYALDVAAAADNDDASGGDTGIMAQYTRL